jgi:UDP-glucose 4-epimerase
MKKILITGASGFIGTNLIEKMIRQNKIVAVDNLSNSSLKNIEKFLDNNNFTFYKSDISLKGNLNKILKKNHNISEVWHLAANSNIEKGINNSSIDLRDTFMTTFHVIKEMENFKIYNLYFASSSAIYGDHGNIKVSENTGPYEPISNYGAMKLASEGICTAAYEKFLKKLIIFRFPNVIGIPATHGVIFDFINKIIKSKYQKLQVLGNGKQKKNYLHVSDLIDAMLKIKNSTKGKRIINIGQYDNGVEVQWIAEQVTKKFKNIEIEYEKNSKGWVGDVPKFNYQLKNLKNLGWRPKLSSKEAIKKSINDILKQIIS